MDPLGLSYYAVICGLLAGFSPRAGGILTRILLGIVVGLLAAALLPYVRAAVG